MISYPQARYPIGTLAQNLEQPADLQADLQTLAGFAERLQHLLSSPDVDLNARYRDASWTVQQLVHHLADSHTHALIRLKWAMTEDQPQIKAYQEAETAELADYQLPIGLSMGMIDSIHRKMLALLQSADQSSLDRRYFHPGRNRWFTVAETARMYAWHSTHHLAHIQIALGKARVAAEV